MMALRVGARLIGPEARLERRGVVRSDIKTRLSNCRTWPPGWSGPSDPEGGLGHEGRAR